MSKYTSPSGIEWLLNDRGCWEMVDVSPTGDEFVLTIDTKGYFSRPVVKKDTPPIKSESNSEKKEGCGGCKKLTLIEKLRGAIKLNKAFNDNTDVSTDVIEHRKAICQQCEHNDIGRCEPCGCIIWAKIRFGGEACPHNHWAAVEKDSEDGRE